MKNTEGLSFRELEHLHETASQKASEYGKWRITVCQGSAVSDIEQLSVSYNEAEFARRDRIIQGCGRILEKHSVPEVDNELRLFDIDKLNENIRSSIDTGDAPGLEELFLNSVFPAEIQKNILNPDTILILFDKAAKTSRDQLNQISADDIFIEELYEKTKTILRCACSTELLSFSLAELYRNTLNTVFSSKRVKDYRPIRIAKEYINIHFAENIDLNAVAKEAGLNPAYFSSLFKKETGIKFKRISASEKSGNS